MITRVEYNSFSDEYYLILPDDLVEQLSLKTGDTLVWSIEGDKVYLSKKEE